MKRTLIHEGFYDGVVAIEWVGRSWEAHIHSKRVAYCLYALRESNIHGISIGV